MVTNATTSFQNFDGSSPDSYPSMTGNNSVNQLYSISTPSSSDSTVFVPYPAITGQAPPITTITPHILPPINQFCGNQMQYAPNTAYITNAIPRQVNHQNNQFQANSPQLQFSNLQNIPFPSNFASNLFASSSNCNMNRNDHQFESPIIAQPAHNITASEFMDNYITLHKNSGPK